MSSQERIDWVVWDIGNVIIRASHAVTHALLFEHGVDAGTAIRFFNIHAYAEFARGRINGATFAENVRRELDTELPDADIRAFHDAHIYGADDAVVELFKRSQQGYARTAFATSTNLWQDERVDLFFRPGSFAPETRIFRSHKTGKLKTDLWAFEEIGGNLTNGKPQRLLFIDDAAANCAAAERAGLQVVRFVSAQQLEAALREKGVL